MLRLIPVPMLRLIPVQREREPGRVAECVVSCWSPVILSEHHHWLNAKAVNLRRG